ncbi:60S ribosomal protein [Venturia nashicola]|uniref:60S ribosomal protein n=1 Tax=Venturia nashicola TaxID=86259 RepID=A0A4Z1PX82_9PEZI|nr:60S ribosomal protein [Venturia nashicola]
MNFSISLLQILGLSLAPTSVTPQGLNVTAISAANGVSVLECWSLSSPPQNARGAANYDIGNFENAFVGVIAPRTRIGYAHAPNVQFVSPLLMSSHFLDHTVQHHIPSKSAQDPPLELAANTMDKLVEKALSSEEADSCQQLYNIIRNFATRKGQVGKKAPTNACANALLTFVLNDDHSRRTRRWACILLEAIVAKIPSLRQYVLGLSNLMPFLGRLVTRDDEEFKLMSATLIRALAESDTQRLSLFWPADELSPSQIRRFPLTDASSGKQWIEDLTSFMDDSFSQTKAFNSQTRLQVNFIQAVDIHGADAKGGDVHIMPEDGSLYMILQSSITIMKVPISSSDPLFLDIPFDKISGVKVQTSTLVASQDLGASESVSQLLLNMEIGAQNHNLCVNEGEARTMLFTFNDTVQANQVATYINDELSQRQTSRPKMSMSQPLNISQDVQASTSPEQPTKAVSPQAMEIDEIEPAPRETSPAIPKSRQAPKHKSTGSTTGGSRRTNTEVATPGARTRLDLDESIVMGDTETEAEKDNGDEPVNETEGTTRPAAGNLLMLLSAALSPEPEKPLVRSVRRTRNGALAVVKGLPHSANIATKPKATSSAKEKQPKQREPATKKTTAVRSRAVNKVSTAEPEQSGKIAEDGIWNIPSDPAELNQTTGKSRKAKIVASTVKNATRKTPARPAKAQANKRRTWVIESESDTESDGDRDDGNFKASSARLIPSSSPRRSLRLQASAVKEESAPLRESRNHTIVGQSHELEHPSLPTRPSPRIRSSYEIQRTGTVGQATKFARSKKESAPVAASIREPQQATKPETRSKKQQIPVSPREGDETPSLNLPPQNESMETIEAFEEAIVDFQTGADIQKKGLVIKKEPGRESKLSEQANKQMGSQKRPLSIASSSESEDDPEDDMQVEGGTQEAAHQVQEVAPTTVTNKVQDNSRATNGANAKSACDEVSMAEDSYPATNDLSALAKRYSTPGGASDPTLVDNQSARKMAIISFDRSGPRNQGFRLGLRSGNGTPTVRSDPVQAREGSNAAEELQATREMSFQTQPTLRLPEYQARDVHESIIEKRVAQNVKRRKTSHTMSKEDGFVDIDSYSDTAGRASRKASQRSVHVTDDGSPIRNDFDEEGTAMSTDFGEVEDDFFHQVSEGAIHDPIMQDVPAPWVEIASQKLKTQANASKGTQTRQRASKSMSPAHGSSRIAMKLAQEPEKPPHNQTVEDNDNEGFFEQGLMSTPRSSQKRSQSRGAEPGLGPVNRPASSLLQPVVSRTSRASLGAPRRRTSSGRAQRSTAPMSSNTKPVPQPPSLDSQVISAYAPEKEVEEAVARNREEEKLNDPFSSSQKNNEANRSFFMRRLATLMEERDSNSVDGHVVEDADKTLVEDVPMEDVENYSSSSEELAVVVEGPEEEDQENAEELEWEAALQPRHRDMFAVLSRITRRLVSHLIDSETAVEDVVEDYGRDGTMIVEEFDKCFRGQQSNIGGLQASVTKLKRIYGDTERQIVQEYKVLQTDNESSLHGWNASIHDKKQTIGQIERMITAQSGRDSVIAMPLHPFGGRVSRHFGEHLSPDDAYLSYHDIRLTKEDIDCIRDDWLTDNGIAFWEEYLEREKLINFPRAHIVLLRPSMSFMLLQTPDALTLKAALPDFSKTSHIFLPVNNATSVSEPESGSHWSLLLVSAVDGVAFHYDSLGEDNYQPARVVAARMSALLGKPLRFVHMHDSPQQDNGSDCGVFVCMVMERLLMDRLLRADIGDKVSMSLKQDKGLDANFGRKHMLKTIEGFRKEGERRRSRSRSPGVHKERSKTPPRIGNEQT